MLNLNSLKPNHRRCSLGDSRCSLRDQSARHGWLEHLLVLFAERTTTRGGILLILALVGPLGVARAAEEKPANQTMALADGHLILQAPMDWVRKQPKNRIIEHEFATPAAEGDSGEGRFTVMGAGGTVETNIARWIGQFSQPDGSATKEKAKIEKLRVSGVEVHLVDIAGDFKDQAGPFAPAVTRPGYRMLGAIIVTEKHGQHFVKLYGPQPTIAKQEKAFQELINGLKVQ